MTVFLLIEPPPTTRIILLHSYIQVRCHGAGAAVFLKTVPLLQSVMTCSVAANQYLLMIDSKAAVAGAKLQDIAHALGLLC